VSGPWGLVRSYGRKIFVSHGSVGKIAQFELDKSNQLVFQKQLFTISEANLGRISITFSSNGAFFISGPTEITAFDKNGAVASNIHVSLLPKSCVQARGNYLFGAMKGALLMWQLRNPKKVRALINPLVKNSDGDFSLFDIRGFHVIAGKSVFVVWNLFPFIVQDQWAQVKELFRARFCSESFAILPTEILMKIGLSMFNEDWDY